MRNIGVDSASIQVSVGVISRNDDYLLTLRPKDTHLGGYWEFPGGKLESGESPQQALVRELNEELGIRVISADPLIRIPYRYSDVDVYLHVFRVTAFENDPSGKEGQICRWVPKGQLRHLQLPPANHGIVAAIDLPELLVITPEPEGENGAFWKQLEQTLKSGTRLVQWRAKGLQAAESIRLAKKAVTLCRTYEARLIFNGTVEMAASSGAHGVHFPAAKMRHFLKSPPKIPPSLIAGASCHNEEEVEMAQEIGIDYILFSPVKPTRSHPFAIATGWERFAAICARSAVPVYALGGMSMPDIADSRACGGHGVAGIGRFWGGFK